MNVSTIGLSNSQKRIWFLQQFDIESPVFNLVFSANLEGIVSIKKLENALRLVIKKHSVLRSSFKNIKGFPKCILKDFNTEVILIKNDLIAKGIKEEIKNIVSKPFYLDEDELIKCVLIENNSNSFKLLIILHHIVCDGYSGNILLNDLFQFYKEGKDTKEEIIIDKSYFSYIEFENSIDYKNRTNKDIEYWKSYLKNANFKINFPLEYKHEDNKIFEGRLNKSRIVDERVKQIKDLCLENKITPFIFFMSVFQCFVFHYLSLDNFVIGTPTLGRPSSRFMKSVGLFINTIFLKSNFSEDSRFVDILRQVKSDVIEGYTHQNLPFNELVNSLNIQRERENSSLIQLMFSYRGNVKNHFKVDDLDIYLNDDSAGIQFTQSDLSLNVSDVDSFYEVELEYSSAIFSERDMSNISFGFHKLINQILDNPIGVLKDFKLVDWGEQSVSSELYGEKESIEQHSIIKMIENVVKLNSNAIAVIDTYNDSSITYSKLNEQANSIASFLLKNGGHGKKKFVVRYNDVIKQITVVLSVLKLGGTFLILDEKTPTNLIQDMLDDFDPDIMLLEGELTIDGKYKKFNVFKTIQFGKSVGIIDNNIVKNSKICAVYTSGSTGNPNGVLLKEDGIINLIQSFVKTYKSKTPHKLLPLTSHTSSSYIGEIFPMLCSGGSLVLTRDFLNFNKIMEACDRYKVSIISTVPSVIEKMNSLYKTVPKSLKFILCGGEQMHYKYISYLYDKVRFFNGYGITEATICSSYFEIKELTNEDSIVPIGKPIINTNIYILNKKFNPVLKGVIGEIYISGLGLSNGYLKNVELEASKFIEMLINNRKEKVYRTGDIGVIQVDGNLKLLGRKDNQVQIRGNRVELSSVKNIIMSHPMVENLVLFLDSNNQQQIICFIKLIKRNITTEIDIKKWSLKSLPRYMVPSCIKFVSSFPINKNGKVNIKKLVEEFEKENIEKHKSYSKPIKKEEQIIFDLWVKILGNDYFGIDENFFDVGGNSLNLMELKYYIDREFNIEIEVVYLFQYTSIKEIANYIISIFLLENIDKEDTIKLSDLEERIRKRQSFLAKKR